MLKAFSFFMILLPFGCFAQATFSAKVLNGAYSEPLNPLKAELLKLKTASDSSTFKLTAEKLYLQFDKPYYALGDTIWLKAYLFNSFLKPDNKSGIINIDITNDSNKVIKQYRLPVSAGLSWGNISLDEKDFIPGTYTLCAYTNWMRNFGDDCLFYKTFYVTGANENNLLVNTLFNISTVNNNLLRAKLLFSNMNKTPFAVKSLLLQVMNGNKRLYKQSFQTGVDGILDVNFNIPQKTSGLVIVAESEQKDKKAVIPIILNRVDKADVQFLPEGGSLVAGLPVHMGYKVIGEDGKGLNVTGIIVDHNQQQVAVFKSLHNGMGSFDLAVKDGESYTAKVTLTGGLTKDYSLPVVKATGTVLQVKNLMENDSLIITIGASNAISQSEESYFLIGKARGIVCYAAIVNFHEGNFVKRKIAKSLFPSGITHFTLLTTKYQPLNERLVFIDQQDNLNIKISSNKPFYGKRDSVALKLKVTDKEGNPVSGNFSLAVTDDVEVKTDTLNSENINTRLLLTSDLKGYIEEPGYYLSSNTNEAWQALDNLLLTQGWVGYDWKQLFSPPAITYQPEHELEIRGHVGNVFNKPVKGTNVLLFSKSPAILMDTLTDNGGEFVFNHFPRVDTPIFVLKAVNKNGKSFNVGITVDEVKSPDFIKPVNPLIMPWYINSDSTLLNYTKNQALIKQQENFPAGGHVLKEVKITAKKIVKGSQNLNGPGNADLVLDEKDLEAAGKKSFLQLLEENVHGFREMNVFPSYPHWYYLHFKKVLFLVDGIYLNDIYLPLDFLTLKNYLESHNAEDIKGIEVMSSAKFALNYASRIRENMDAIVFIEITTRSGHGPVIDNTPGMYLYKPLPISWPKQFYKPKYAVNDTAKHLPDLRSTIDWEPNITTDINGEASVSFYTADKPSTYTIIMEGSDMNGSLGYKLEHIMAKK
jgi:hypothetical protein